MEKSIRQKTYYCGVGKAEYLEVDLFPVSMDDEPRGCRGRRRKMSSPQQKKLNKKRAARYLALLLKTNFGKGDYHITLTYEPDQLPADIEGAEKIVNNYIKRIKRACKKAGMPMPKYIWITEQAVRTGRIHHHMVISCQLNREQLEDMWSVRKKSIGHANADRLRTDDKKGLDALAAYLSKDPKGRKSWHPSRNLRKPEVSTNDSACSRKQYMQLSLWPEDCEEARNYFERRFTGYYVTEIVKEYNHITGQWAIYAKLRKKPDSLGREKRK